MRGAARLLERCFWAIGFLALSLWLAVWFTARWYQAEGNRELERRLDASRSSKTPSPIPPVRLAKGDLIGRIEIPRLDLSTVIFEGDDDDVLKMGVGHLAGSPLPGEAGNVVLAAHRDTFFRPLRNIRSHDRIDVVTPAGTRRYQVDSTDIVTPDHISVLAPTPAATLTLVTCFPFDWFGHAPMRFIVRAHELKPPNSPPDSPKTAAKIPQTPVRESHVMGAVDDSSRGPRPHVLSPDVRPDETRPSVRKVSRREMDTQPRLQTVSAPASKLEAAPVVMKDTDTLQTKDDVAARASSDEAISQADPAPAPKPSGNRILRGLKKLNPAPVWSKITGNS